MSGVIEGDRVAVYRPGPDYQHSFWQYEDGHTGEPS